MFLAQARRGCDALNHTGLYSHLLSALYIGSWRQSLQVQAPAPQGTAAASSSGTMQRTRRGAGKWAGLEMLLRTSTGENTDACFQDENLDTLLHSVAHDERSPVFNVRFVQKGKWAATKSWRQSYGLCLSASHGWRATHGLRVVSVTCASLVVLWKSCSITNARSARLHVRRAPVNQVNKGYLVMRCAEHVHDEDSSRVCPVEVAFKRIEIEEGGTMKAVWRAYINPEVHHFIEQTNQDNRKLPTVVEKQLLKQQMEAGTGRTAAKKWWESHAKEKLRACGSIGALGAQAAEEHGAAPPPAGDLSDTELNEMRDAALHMLSQLEVTEDSKCYFDQMWHNLYKWLVRYNHGAPVRTVSLIC